MWCRSDRSPLPRGAVLWAAGLALGSGCGHGDHWSPIDAAAPAADGGEGDAQPPSPDAQPPSPDAAAVTPVVLVEDGGWCWYQDERAVFQGTRLAVASLSHEGDVQVSSYDLSSGARSHAVLHRRLQRDDHDVASLLPLGDGGLLAFYSRHSTENVMYYRRSAADLSWQEERTLSIGDRVCYSNPFELEGEAGGSAPRIYLFFRGLHFNPTFVVSDDTGGSWSAAGQLLDSFAVRPDGTRRDHRPYVKYASDGTSTIHLVYTDGHPSEFNGTAEAPERNSIYHLYCRDGQLHRSDGTVVASLVPGKDVLLAPAQGTRVYDGNTGEGGEAWTWDLALDETGSPVTVFATFPDPSSQATELAHHQYRYARFDGVAWRDHFVAFAGRGLHPQERFYSGGIALDPDDPAVVYFSSNANVVDGSPGDSGRYEIYRARTADGGATWTFSAITRGSVADNLRPIVPARHPTATAVLWLQGAYDSYVDYSTRVVGLFCQDDCTAQEAPFADPLVSLARFDVNSAQGGTESPTEAGFTGALAAETSLAATASGITLAVQDLVGDLDRGHGGALHRDLVFNDRGGSSLDDKLTVRLSGLAPGADFLVRLHSYDFEHNPLDKSFWFLGTTATLLTDGNDQLLGAHRLGNVDHGGGGFLALRLPADDRGEIDLLARGFTLDASDDASDDRVVVLNGIEIASRPDTEVVARFDVDRSPGPGTKEGYTSLSFDDAISPTGSATAAGVTLSVTSDRLDCLRQRGPVSPAVLPDFVFGDDELVAELGGLLPGTAYEITVYSADEEMNLHHASRWLLEEDGSQPSVVRAFHVNNRTRGPTAWFTFYHRARTAAIRLRGHDLVYPVDGARVDSVVFLNGLDLAEVR